MVKCAMVYGRYQCGSRLLSAASKQEELSNQLRAMISLLRDEESGICRYRVFFSPVPSLKVLSTKKLS